MPSRVHLGYILAVRMVIGELKGQEMFIRMILIATRAQLRFTRRVALGCIDLGTLEVSRID